MSNKIEQIDKQISLIEDLIATRSNDQTQVYSRREDLSLKIEVLNKVLNDIDLKIDQTSELNVQYQENLAKLDRILENYAIEIQEESEAVAEETQLSAPYSIEAITESEKEVNQMQAKLQTLKKSLDLISEISGTLNKLAENHNKTLEKNTEILNLRARKVELEAEFKRLEIRVLDHQSEIGDIELDKIVSLIGKR